MSPDESVIPADYCRCEGCHSFARLRAMGEPTVRPDRTERLVHTLLRSDLLDTQEVDTAQAIVALARELAMALDEGVKDTNFSLKPGFATITWRGHESYLDWVARLLRKLENHQALMGEETLRCTGWQDIAVAYVFK